jgi:hypothetical protein
MTNVVLVTTRRRRGQHMSGRHKTPLWKIEVWEMEMGEQIAVEGEDGKPMKE